MAGAGAGAGAGVGAEIMDKGGAGAGVRSENKQIQFWNTSKTFLILARAPICLFCVLFTNFCKTQY